MTGTQAPHCWLPAEFISVLVAMATPAAHTGRHVSECERVKEEIYEIINSRCDEVVHHLNLKLIFGCERGRFGDVVLVVFVCLSVSSCQQELQRPSVFQTLLLGVIVSFSHSIGSFTGGNTSFRLSMCHVYPDFNHQMFPLCFGLGSRFRALRKACWDVISYQRDQSGF